MGIRRSAVAILVVVAGAATATVAEGHGLVSGPVGSATATGTTVTASPPLPTPGSPNVPSSERTHPHVRPATGGRLTSFTLAFTLREAPGHQDVFAVDYRVQVTAPTSAAASCMPTPPPMIESGTAGASEQITLTPPAGGWCAGTYLVTVFLQRGPYCPSPVEGQQPIACPEFATQELDTGSASFVIGSNAHLVSVPNLRGLTPASADRRLKRRHLRVRYTALSNLCAGIPPHGRIILQEPAAGVKVPRGSRVLVQTSCGP
jgi:PASTA domain